MSPWTSVSRASVKGNAMQVVAFLSDLKSLSVCPHQAAINLVSVHKTIQDRDQQLVTDSRDGQDSIEKTVDTDLQRADELVSLHQNVKLKHIESGPDAELSEARRAVSRVLASLNNDR